MVGKIPMELEYLKLFLIKIVKNVWELEHQREHLKIPQSHVWIVMSELAIVRNVMELELFLSITNFVIPVKEDAYWIRRVVAVLSQAIMKRSKLKIYDNLLNHFKLIKNLWKPILYYNINLIRSLFYIILLFLYLAHFY